MWTQKISEAGASRLRINDPYHDISQIAKAIRWSKTAGMTTVVALIYSYSPVHTDDFYAAKAREFLDRAGVDELVIEDTSGILTPEPVPSVRAFLCRSWSNVLVTLGYRVTVLAAVLLHL